MSEYVGTLVAEAEKPGGLVGRERRGDGPSEAELARMRAHDFGSDVGEGLGVSEKNPQLDAPADLLNGVGSQSPQPLFADCAKSKVGHPEGVVPGEVEEGEEESLGEFFEILGPGESEEERQRRTYRGRVVGMLRRYMQCSIETGRLPSLLGREFFRAKVTSYTAVTFEDRVIFVHDMERCIDRLDEFSQQLIARHILQEHDRWATARLLHCNEKTVRRLTPLALDQLAEILLDLGLMERLDSNCKNSCQGGLEDDFSVSDCEDGKNKF